MQGNSLKLTKDEILKDYRIGYMSRLASLIGRREVLSGKAKFGIFGDGKEVAQLAMARSFKKGDWRSGYYRDQTFMLAIGELTIQQFFAQLYANTNKEKEPASAGRQMNSHFASRYIQDDGSWVDQTKSHNIAADLSPTAGQMVRLVGLGYASKLYRESKALKNWAGSAQFSVNGNEVAFGTIGNASTSEGVFWESFNAAGVLQIPLVISVWDDGYGISVPAKYHTTKQSISKALAGFQSCEGEKGFDIYVVKGWDYQTLVNTYSIAVEKSRTQHSPALIHVEELTQPQGHSTSGSHERYKSAERLKFEEDMDCLKKMRDWMITNKIVSDSELIEIEKSTEQFVNSSKEEAWQDFVTPLHEERKISLKYLESVEEAGLATDEMTRMIRSLRNLQLATKRNIQSVLERSLMQLRGNRHEAVVALSNFAQDYKKKNSEIYNSFLYASGQRSPLQINGERKIISENSQLVDGREIINRYFKTKLADDPRVFLIGEDVGKIGGVNAEYDGLQEVYGEERLTDTGIREASIFGQGMGAAMRGLRPIVEIQYLDYLLYCLQPMSDDLASLHYRTAGGQAAPCIVRTRGHRLEGIWHTGSPIGMIINSLRGIHVCVPRNSAQAAGMYETLLAGDDPALVIECLNGFRVKEPLPENLGTYKVPLGVPEVLSQGSDVTLVTYGSNVRIAEEAIVLLEKMGISVELIDVQTLLPFDINKLIRNSIEKTNAVVFFDEDVSGGASAYMMRQVLDRDGGYDYLDAKPVCLSAKDNRSAYASDGDYYCKPNAEDVIETIYNLMHEREPNSFPLYHS